MPDQAAVAVELERLRGSVDTGFATLNGKLEVALQRTTALESDIAALNQRVSTLEKGRWPLPSLAALVGLIGLLVSVYVAATQ
ncbi:hypothetical protein [Streptomyces abikoensis]|uniref:hypothetical protein n=1 Tax=Streptomyces abikoensis TaxID=97398 RepID=UPI0019BACD45|nr:hypothetical protein [Streptomyces abikoensis]GGP56107.1 hypothetical protein GCM10010214_31690 [Streptomyces abikoensis]